MGAITIRKIEEGVKARLRIRAAHHGRSMEEEAREILRAALAEEVGPEPNLADSIRKRIAPLGGVDLPVPVRDPMRPPPEMGA